MLTEYSRRIAIRFAHVLGVLVTLALVDVLVLETMLKPVSATHDMPFSMFEFDTSLPLLGEVTLLRWWPILWALAGLLAVHLGVLLRRVDAPVAVVVLLALGVEDVLYYWLQGQPPPAELPWLDLNPLMAPARAMAGGEHVTGAGLYVTAAIGLLLGVGALIGGQWLSTRRARKGDVFVPGSRDETTDRVIDEALKKRGATAVWRRGEARDVDTKSR